MTRRRAPREPPAALDVLSIVEAAYAVDATPKEWTGGLLDATIQALGTDLGGFACGFHAKPDHTLALDLGSAALARLPPASASAIFDGLTAAPPGWLSAYLGDARSASFCALTSEVDPQLVLAYRADLARTGVHDGINIVCMDLDRHGILISLGLGRDVLVPAAIRRDLVRVATHVVAGLRLRSRGVAAQAGAPTTEGPQAVLSPDGKVLDATGEAELADARRALQTAVRDIERARQSSRAEPQEALALWKGLVSARWTLVDEFDAHGARYVVARRNAPAAAALPKLTHAERCVVAYAARGFSTKEIAYTLGISDTTVRVLFMRAANRCGAQSRAELLRLAVATLDLDVDPRGPAAGRERRRQPPGPRAKGKDA